MKFQVGDRVTFLNRIDPFKREFGVVLSLGDYGPGTVQVKIDGVNYSEDLIHNMNSNSKVSNLELESIYNSPLYQALKEDP